MQISGVRAAIQELEKDVQKIQHVIGILRSIRVEPNTNGNSTGRKSRRLSPQGRRRIALAAKKRWTAYRAANK
jgi:hypothetical protein